jgi:hypothetical protein
MRQRTTCKEVYTHLGRHLPDAVKCEVLVHKVARMCFTLLKEQSVAIWRALMGGYEWDGIS